MLLGQTLAGMQVWDVRRCVQMLRELGYDCPIILKGDGECRQPRFVGGAVRKSRNGKCEKLSKERQSATGLPEYFAHRDARAGARPRAAAVQTKPSEIISRQSSSPRIPTTPIMESVAVKVSSVSFSVIPLILLITQKPLSFIHGKGLEPQPMASARYTGW